MDISNAYENLKLADELIETAKEYSQARERAGKAERELNIFLVGNLSTIREKKPNIGYDMAVLMLLEIEPEAKSIYTEYKHFESKYKGLEKILEAIKSKISLVQSQMKWQQSGEITGGE